MPPHYSVPPLLSSPDPLDQVILNFSEDDAFTIRDACEGVQILGGIGSGKTSGSGAHLAHAYLNAGFGGLVLTAKPDETDLWRSYAAQTGRSEDLILFGQEHAARFNALDYERTRQGRGAGLTDNLVELFSLLGQIGNRSNGDSNGMQDGSFWRTEQRKLVRNTIEMLSLAGLPVSFPNIHVLIQSAPTSEKILSDVAWQQKSFFYDAFLAVTELEEKRAFDASQLSDWKICRGYWLSEFPRQSDRTRAVAMAMCSGISEVFARGLLRRLFSGDTTLRPEDTFEGKVIVLDLPQKLFNEVGVYAQVLFKYCWQRAIERRKIQRNSRPVFLWADESQHFVNEYDVGFQTTARSSRVCTVFLTQNLPNYHFALGGNERARVLVDSLLGNLVTKIFHNNTCAATNQYAAELFARDWRQRHSQNYSQQKDGMTFGGASAPQLDFTVLPREFSGLMKGGPENDYCVEAIIHQGGKRFNTSGINALQTVFRQRPA